MLNVTSERRTAMRLAAQIPAPLLHKLFSAIPGGLHLGFIEEVLEYRAHQGPGPQLVRLFIDDPEATERESYAQNSASALMLLNAGQSSWPRASVKEFILKNFPVDAPTAASMADTAWRAGESPAVIAFCDAARSVAYHTQSASPNELLMELISATRLLPGLKTEVIAGSAFALMYPIIAAGDAMMTISPPEWVAIAASGLRPSTRMDGVVTDIWPVPFATSSPAALGLGVITPLDQSQFAKANSGLVAATVGAADAASATDKVTAMVRAGVAAGAQGTAFTLRGLLLSIEKQGARHPWARALIAAYNVDRTGTSLIARAAATIIGLGDALEAQPRGTVKPVGANVSVALVGLMRKIEAHDEYARTFSATRLLSGAEQGGVIVEQGGMFDNLAQLIRPIATIAAPLLGGMMGGPLGMTAGLRVSQMLNTNKTAPATHKQAFKPVMTLDPSGPAFPEFGSRNLISRQAAGFPGVEEGGLFGSRKKKKKRGDPEADIEMERLRTELESLRSQRTEDERAQRQTEMLELVSAARGEPQQPSTIIVERDNRSPAGVQQETADELLDELNPLRG